MADIAIIVGAPNDKSRLNGILQYATDFLNKRKKSYEIIKVHTLPPEDLITANFNSDKIKRVNEIVEHSSGVLVLTPVYKASYSGILKTYLDLLPQKGLENKAVLPLVIGGSYGHLLTIEYALNPILSTLGATHIVNGVYVVDQQIERNNDQTFIIQEQAQQRLQKSLNSFIETL